MFDEKTTRHLAELSKLSYSADELKQITREMDEIVALMDTVADFKAEGDGYVSDGVAFENLRTDTPADSLPREAILSNAKGANGKNFIVPKVV